MKSILKKTKYPIALVFSFSFLLTTFYLPPSTQAIAQQVPEFMVTWKANSYVPSDYQGKVLPTNGSRIEMALELIDGGKLVNLSGTQVRWLINNGELKFGTGMKSISFLAEGIKGDQVVDVTVVGYRGQNWEKTVTIPLASPEIVISGGPNIFRAIPYFFSISNISQLRFNWTANGTPASGLVENPDIIELDSSKVPVGGEISLNVSAQNTRNPKELAEHKIRIEK